MRLSLAMTRVLFSVVSAYTEWWGAGVVVCLEQGADLHYGPAGATATHCLLLQ